MTSASQLSAALRAPARPAPFSFRGGRSLRLPAAAALLGSALIAAGERWPVAALPTLDPFLAGQFGAQAAATPTLFVILQLGAAALIGMLITAVQRDLHRERTLSRSMEQAQTLLCVAGALMMIIIGSSLARAFGIAGAAAIIRFRTPVDDPRDTTILFLLLALGMAAGIGALSVAGIGTLALCLLLPALNRFSGATPRVATLDCTAASKDFPSDLVRGILARYQITAEPREVVQGDAPRIKYQVTLSPGAQLEEVTQALVESAGLTAVTWDVRKKS